MKDQNIKELQNGVCSFIDKQIEFYHQMQFEFAGEEHMIQFFKGAVEGLNQARTEIIREGALMEND